jgi:hypothetical protein
MKLWSNLFRADGHSKMDRVPLIRLLSGMRLLIIGVCWQLLALAYVVVWERTQGWIFVPGWVVLIGNLTILVLAMIWAWRAPILTVSVCAASLVAGAFLYLVLLSWTKLVYIGFDDPGSYLPVFPMLVGVLVFVLVVIRLAVRLTAKLSGQP